jgi:hypothetical protein
MFTESIREAGNNSMAQRLVGAAPGVAHMQTR